MPRKRTEPRDPVKAAAGRIGAYSNLRKRGAHEVSRPAREGFNRKFIDEVDPDGKLPEAERLRRAEFAKKEHFARLAMRSAMARRKKTTRKSGGDHHAA